MNTLLQTHQFLANALQANPLLCLAHTVSVLDPFWRDDDLDENNVLTSALRITRDAFPDIYALAVDALRQGKAEDEMDRLLCAEVSKKGIPLDTVEAMDYGIPLPAYGVVLSEPEFYSQHPNVLPAVQLFGIQPDETPVK